MSSVPRNTRSRPGAVPHAAWTAVCPRGNWEEDRWWDSYPVRERTAIHRVDLRVLIVDDKQAFKLGQSPQRELTR